MLGRCRQYGDPRLLEVTKERNGPSGLRDDDDDDDDDDDKLVPCEGFHVNASYVAAMAWVQ